jgi:hypothetical protein
VQGDRVSQGLFPPDPASERWTFVDGFFDGSKTMQSALIGAYETCGGEHGSFLLILAWPQGKAPAIRFVHEMPEEPFGILAAIPDATIQVFHCMS